MIASEPKTKVLTYEDYMAEEPIMRRYDIIDGVRTFMTNPTVRHQDILLSLADAFRTYQRATKRGKVIVSPCDILISRQPFRTRQPDLLFISRERLGDRSADDPSPLAPAPEIVVEILSPSNTPRSLKSKILEYCSAGALECWLVSSDSETVDVLRLTPGGPEPLARYSYDQTVQSAVLPDLAIKVADIFEIET